MTHNTRKPLVLSALLAATLAAGAQPAEAQSEAQPQVEGKRSGPQVDIEVDPIAYALHGYSLHAGLTWDRFRLDLGAFALEVPEALHGVEGLDVYGSGFGAKLDYHPFESLDGLFVGTQLSRGREIVTHSESGESKTARYTTVGARIGYRIDIVDGFYALPWIGVDVALSDRNQTVAGVDYEQSRAIFFPTIHIGKKF